MPMTGPATTSGWNFRAALMFFYALGAIFAPLTTSGLIAAYGPARSSGSSPRRMWGFWSSASAHAARPVRTARALCLDPAHLVPGGRIFRKAPRDPDEALTSGLRPATAVNGRKVVIRRHATGQARRHGTHPDHFGDPLHQRDQAPGQPVGSASCRPTSMPATCARAATRCCSLRHRRTRHPRRAGRRQGGQAVAEYTAPRCGRSRMSWPGLPPVLRPFRPLLQPAEPRADPAFRGRLPRPA
jgi:hypothetical protein